MYTGAPPVWSTIIWGGYLSVYLCVLLLFLHTLVFSSRNSFYLEIRGRLMLCLELVLNGAISTCFALRQVSRPRSS
jgi:hypothetical protein